MKKIVFLAAALMASMFILTSCEKEKTENYATSNLQQFSQVSLFDEAMFLKSEGQYDDYVKKLGEATGIDIEEISCLPSVMQLSQSSINMINYSFSGNTRGALTEQKMGKIRYYNSKIQEEDGYGNELLVLQYYDSLCAVCRTISGFVFGMNEYGLETISVDENNLTLPINEMNAYVELYENIECELSTRDGYNNLTEEEQKEVKEAALYVCIKDSSMTPKMCETYEGCINTANGTRAAALAGASAAFCLGVAETCAPLAAAGGLGALACIAVYTGIYTWAVCEAQSNYNRDVELCNYKYGRN